MHYHVCFRQVTRVVSCSKLITAIEHLLRFCCCCCYASLLDPHSVQMGPPPTAAGLQPMPPLDCESPYRYPSLYPQPPPGTIHQHLIQPPPPIHHTSSAFCPMPPQAHHDPTGKSNATFLIQFSMLDSQSNHGNNDFFSKADRNIFMAKK